MWSDCLPDGTRIDPDRSHPLPPQIKEIFLSQGFRLRFCTPFAIRGHHRGWILTDYLLYHHTSGRFYYHKDSVLAFVHFVYNVTREHQRGLILTDFFHKDSIFRTHCTFFVYYHMRLRTKKESISKLCTLFVQLMGQYSHRYL